MSDSKTQILGVEAAAVPAASHGNLEPEKAIAGRRTVEQLFLDYYGLNEQPFGVTPDLRFLYLGAKHRQALDALNFGTELNRGFLTLIAEPGMGKTSLLFHYLEGLRDKARTVFLFQTDGDSTQLMRYLLADLGIDGKGMDLPEMRAVLSQILMGEMQAGRRFVLVVDEAQNLSDTVLESIRLLSNFETPWMKLMHIVLAGQPQLAERLAKPSMAQFRQRVSFAIRIEPFNRQEADLYIDHRLWVAGYKGPSLFSVGARGLIAERSEGIPRNINNICFCAMSYAWALKRKTIDRDTLSEAVADIGPGTSVSQARQIPITREAPITSKPLQEPESGRVQIQQPSGLTLQSSQERKWLSKLAAVCLLALVLGWTGLQPGVEKWVGSSVSAASTAIRNFLAPASADAPKNPAGNVAPDHSSTVVKPQGAPDLKEEINAPNQGAISGSSVNDGKN